MQSSRNWYVQNNGNFTKFCVYISTLIFSGLLVSCGKSFQTISNAVGGSETSASSNFGAVQMTLSASGVVQITAGDNLNLSAEVTTPNAIESATWQVAQADGTYQTVSGTTTSVDLSTSQTTDTLSFTNVGASAAGTYRASVVVRSLDGTTTQTFNSNLVQVMVNGTSTGPSANGATIPPASQLVDAHGNVWTVASGVVSMNGNQAGYSAGVTLLLYYNGTIYQQTPSGWWSWINGNWSAVSGDPRTKGSNPTPAPTAAPTAKPTPAPTASPAPTAAPTPPTPASGGPGAPTIFSVSGVGGVSGVYPTMNGAYILFSPPSNAASLSAGGKPIQSYVATAYNSSGVAVATATSDLNTSVNAVSARVDFRGSLSSSGGPYTIKVAATNANGAGPQSTASAQVSPNAYADYYLYSGAASGLSSAWGDYNGSVNMLSQGRVLSGETHSMQITGGTGDPWFIGFWTNPLAGGGYAGMFDLGPYKYVVMKVFPVDQASANAINVGFAYEEFIFGVCGTGSAGGTCVDPTQDFTAGSLLTGGGLGNSPRIATVNPNLPYNSVSANTANSISSGGGQSFSAGTPYMWSVQDVRSVPIATPLTTSYGTLTPGVWNQIKIPISVLDNLDKGYTQELGISLSNGGTMVYITDVGFTAN